MPVGIPRRDIEIVEHLGFFREISTRFYRKFLNETGDDIAPRFLTEAQVKSFDCQLRRLLCRETRPFVLVLFL